MESMTLHRTTFSGWLQGPNLSQLRLSLHLYKPFFSLPEFQPAGAAGQGGYSIGGWGQLERLRSC